MARKKLPENEKFVSKNYTFDQEVLKEALSLVEGRSEAEKVRAVLKIGVETLRKENK